MTTMRGRGQRGTLGTLLPHQGGRWRPSVGLRTGRDSNPSADDSSTDRTTTDRTTSADNPTDADAYTSWRAGASTAGRRASRTAAAVTSRSTALRYASWGWPVTPSITIPATTDLEQVFATWSRLPDAPILAACGVAFDVIETEALAGRAALARLDRLGVDLGPVTIDAVPAGFATGAGSGSLAGFAGLGIGASGSARSGRLAAASHPMSGADQSSRIGFLVRADSAAPLTALLDPETGPALLGHGTHVELPRMLDQPEPFRPTAMTGRVWLRPPGTPRPTLPTAHVVFGALALIPRRAPAASPLSR